MENYSRIPITQTTRQLKLVIILPKLQEIYMATCMTFQQISSFLHLILQIASKIRAAGTKKKKFFNYPRG